MFTLSLLFLTLSQEMQYCSTCKNVENHANLHLLPSMSSCGRTAILRARIMGGDQVKPGEMPWMVLLTDRTGEGFCGGALISKHHVLTAAHCTHSFKQSPENIIIRMGDNDLVAKSESFKENRGPRTNIYAVQLIIQHEDFNYNHAYNDISLLKLSEEVQFNKYILPICLPTTCKIIEEDLVGKHVIVAGWGNLYEGDAADSIGQLKSTDLRKLQKTVVRTQDNCPYYNFDAGRVKTISSQMCAIYRGNLEESKDACKGDSGGPLTYTAKWGDTYKVYQVGIVSHGDLCVNNTRLKTITHNPRTPAIYIRVSSYISWILNHLSE